MQWASDELVDRVHERVFIKPLAMPVWQQKALVGGMADTYLEGARSGWDRETAIEQGKHFSQSFIDTLEAFDLDEHGQETLWEILAGLELALLDEIFPA
jgi:hypothetical protein